MYFIEKSELHLPLRREAKKQNKWLKITLGTGAEVFSFNCHREMQKTSR